MKQLVKTPQSLLALILLLGFVIGCHFGGRLNYDSDDIKSAQKVADQYFTALKNKKFAAAIELAAPDFRRLIKEPLLASDIDGRFAGETIREWTPKESTFVPGPVRRVKMVYAVRSASVTRDFELVAELVPNPDRWQFVAANIVNDATANAEQARIKAQQFIDGLREHRYEEGRDLFSDYAKKKNSPKDMTERGQEFEKGIGDIQRSEMVGNYDTTGTLTGERRSYTVLAFQIEGTRHNVLLFFTMFKPGDAWQIEAISANEATTAPDPE